MSDSKELVEAAAIAAWKHAAGKGLRNHAVPLSLEGKTLVIAVADNVWQKQLGAMKGQLLFRVNSILGQTFVAQIDLRIEPHRFTPQALPKSTTEVELLDSDVPLELLSAASTIQNKHLRQTFLRAAINSTKRLENR